MSRQLAPQWKKQLARELLRPKLKKFPRRSVYAKRPGEIWTSDLIDMQQYSKFNKGYKYILAVIDVFSRYAWARPLKSKSGSEVAKAFMDIFNEGHTPKKLWTDRGKEYYNFNVQHLLQANNIQLYSTHNEPKAMIAERFIRTLRRKIQSNYIITQSTVWFDILPCLLDEYNKSYHRSIKMTPEEACLPENFLRVYRTQFKRQYPIKDLMNIGDHVRISLQKKIFEKGSTSNFSEEIYVIRKIVFTNPITYKLRDLSGQNLEGSFYTEQLQKTDQKIYRLDKVLKRRKVNGKEVVFVSWCGYPDKFNQWIPSEDVYA